MKKILSCFLVCAFLCTGLYGCGSKKTELIEEAVVVKKSRHEKYLFLICFFKSRHEEYFCRSCFFKSGHGQ